MALRQSDVQIHNNPDLAVVDSNFVKGGFRTAVGSVSGLYALSGKTDLPAACGQVKEHATIVYVTGDSKYYILKDVNNIANVNGWEEFGGGAGTLTGVINGLHLSGTSIIALGGVLTGNTNFSNGILGYTLHPTFTDGKQIVDKQYVDDYVTGLKPKAAVKVATVSGITLSGLQTIDTIPLYGGERVLVKNQASGQTNGIYIVSATTWTRSSDFDGTPASETVSGAYMWVLTGSTNENTAWVLDSPDPIIFTGVSATSLNFVLFSHVQDVDSTVGSGIVVTISGVTHYISLDATAMAVRNYGVTGATNGLNNTGTTRTIKLGGALTKNTVVGTDTHSIYIGNATNLAGLFINSGATPSISTWLGGLSYIYAEDTTGSVNLCADNGGIHTARTHLGTNNTGFTSAYAESVVFDSTFSGNSGHNVEIDRFEIFSCCNPYFCGAKYDCDYSACFTYLSIPHLGYVTGYTSSLSNKVAVYSVTGLSTYSATTSNDYIGVSGITSGEKSIYLPSNPAIGQRVIVADVCGNALTDNIVIYSTGVFPFVNNDGSVRINTDYGSMTFIFNGCRWSPVALL